MTNKKKMELIKGDFKNVLYLVWKHLGLPDPTPMQYEMADFLQNNNEKRMIQAYRGVGKSWITAAYVLWRLLGYRDSKFLVVSASKSRSDDFTNFTKKLIREMPLFQSLMPEPSQRDSAIAFDVGGCKPAHSPSVKSVGISGQLTGTRANEIIADDIEVVNNSQTQDMREQLIQKTTEFSSIIVPGGKITYLGTPQTEESIYTGLEERGFNITIWTAYYPELKKLHNYNNNLAKSIMDKVDDTELWNGITPTDPSRFNREVLLDKEMDMGKSNFTLQFMLDTTLSDQARYPLKLSDFIVFDINENKAPMNLSWGTKKEQQVIDLPNVGFAGDRYYRPFFVDDEWVNYQGIVMTIDPSGRGADETAYSIVAYLNGFIYILACGGIDGGYEDETLFELAKLAKTYKVNEVLIESNFGDGMFNKLFSPVLFSVHKCGLGEIRNNTQKEKRIIDTLEPLMNRHKLIISPQLIMEDYKTEDINKRLLYQITRITKSKGALKHDDRLDVLAMGVAHFIENMDIDSAKAVKEYKQKQLEEDLEEFINEAYGSMWNTNNNNNNLCGGDW